MTVAKLFYAIRQVIFRIIGYSIIEYFSEYRRYCDVVRVCVDRDQPFTLHRLHQGF